MTRDIYITGVGVVSPHGNTPAACWAALCDPQPPAQHDLTVAGRSRTVQAYICDPAAYQRSPEQYYIDMGVQAIGSAWKDSGDTTDHNCAIVLGSGMGPADELIGRPAVPGTYLSCAVAAIASGMGTTAPLSIIANACCAGAQAITYACDLLRSRRYNRVIAGGVEAFSYLVYCGFQRLQTLDPCGCRPFHPQRRGIAVGDGAAFFVLQREPGKKNYGVIKGHAVTNDAYHVVSPEPRGEQAGRAQRQALQQAGITPQDIDAVVAHGTGTRQNDDLEARLIHALFGPVDILAPKQALGHTGGACGAFNLLAAVECLHTQMLPMRTQWSWESKQPLVTLQTKPYARRLQNLLVDCFAFGGTNTALVCSRADQ